MKTFLLPDLGEGLPEAEVREWYVAVGDTLTADEPMVAMETAKAVVDVPAPFSGVLKKCYGQPGDIIQTDAPLVDIEVEGSDTPKETLVSETACESAATVAGSIEVGNEVIAENATGIETHASTTHRATILPAVRLLAQELGVNPETLKGTGEQGAVTVKDIVKAYQGSGGTVSRKAATTTCPTPAPETFDSTPLRSVRRAMHQAMTDSHANIPPVTLMDAASLDAWEGKQDITCRVVRAIQKAVEAVPVLNSWFNTAEKTLYTHHDLHLGIAMDAGEGLFVPVIRSVTTKTPKQWREDINRFKQQLTDRSLPSEDLQGYTLMLSNFGTLAGRYATPMLTPPCVAILGTGTIHEAVVAMDGAPHVQRVMPLSLTVDHRVITGGEAARFLRALMDDLILST